MPQVAGTSDIDLEAQDQDGNGRTEETENIAPWEALDLRVS